MTLTTMRRDIAVAFSLATLITIRIWLPIWNECYQRTFAMKTSVSSSYVIASLLALCALAAAILTAGCISRRLPSNTVKGFAQAALICSLCVPLNSLRSIYGAEYFALSRYAISTSANKWPGFLLLLVVATVGCVFWRFRPGLARVTYAGLMVMFPLVPLNLFHLVWAEAGRHRYESEIIAGPLPQAPAQGRVVWVIFDEWDYDLTFDHRPADLKLPELDLLRSESLFASNASSPAWHTRISVPVLTTGMMLRKVTETGRSDARLTPINGRDEVRWSKTSTVFSEARALGFNTSVVGCYLPYCRVLGHELSSCWWSEAPNLVSSTGSSVPEITFNQVRSLIETQNLSPFGTSLLAAGFVRMYRDVLSHSESTLREQETGLAYFHFPIPHPPTIYDASGEIMRVRSRGAHGYFDNLVLVDKTIKRLRDLMSADGSWKHTTLLLTSDHSYREASLLNGRHDVRVPFILKMARDETPAPVTMPFNNVLTRELILSVLRGEIRTNAGAAVWLKRASGSGGNAVPESTREVTKMDRGRHANPTRNR